MILKTQNEAYFIIKAIKKNNDLVLYTMNPSERIIISYDDKYNLDIDFLKISKGYLDITNYKNKFKIV